MVLPKSSLAGDKTSLYVLAGVGLKDSLNAAKELYAKKNPGVEVRFIFASAGVLQKQIEEGVPGDIFIVPGKKQMDELQKEGIILSKTRVDLLGNGIVLIVTKEKKDEIKSFGDLPTKHIQSASDFPSRLRQANMHGKLSATLALWEGLRTGLFLQGCTDGIGIC